MTTDLKPEGRLTRARKRASKLGGVGRGLLENLPDLLLGEGFGDVQPELPEEDGPERDRVRPARRRKIASERRPSTLVSVIAPRQPGVAARAREAWRYRRMALFFGSIYLEKLYRRTILGWIWIPLRPVISVGTRVFVFGALLAAPSLGIPYLLFFLIGYAAWQFFAYTLFWGTRSIELGGRVIAKMYVPRLTCLAGAAVPSGVNLGLYIAIAAIVVTGYLIGDGTTYLSAGPNVGFVFVGLALEIAVALSIACFTSVVCARARDVRFSIAYVLRFWFFLTPVIYPLSEVPGAFETVASLNPMTAPIELVRLGLFGIGDVPMTALVSTIAFISVVGVTGLWFFNRSEALALDAF